MSASEVVLDELMLSPPRVARMVRMTVVVGLVVIISMALRVPSVAVSAYMVFFVAQQDVGLTTKTAIGGVLGITAAIALCFVCLLLVIDEPALRIPLMVVLAFTGVYLMRTTPTGGLALLVGFLAFYGMTMPDQVSSPEALVHGLLWLWVIVCYPVMLLTLSDVVLGAGPDDVYRSGIADRLAGAIAVLEAPDAKYGKASVRLQRLVRLGAGDLSPYVARAGSAATAPLRATLDRKSTRLNSSHI